ncbi:MAG TPA: phage BR0599 family protein, partial [Pseudolabrys sp.]|nr:phage BR0599 family protein [Pseudolabrys sp.]
ELWLVDWSEPSLRVLLAKGVLGEIKRDGPVFTAELRGLSDRLTQDTGRLFATTCSADLGDARCKIDLTLPAYRGSGVIDAVTAVSAFTASGLDAYADGWFTAGKLTFTAGANAGLSVEVKTHRNNTAVAFSLWQAMPQPIAAGDAFVVTAGCDKAFATCHGRFANVVNFRGFPHIPGNDFVMSYPVAGGPGNDGSSLN